MLQLGNFPHTHKCNCKCTVICRWWEWNVEIHMKTVGWQDGCNNIELCCTYIYMYILEFQIRHCKCVGSIWACTVFQWYRGCSSNDSMCRLLYTFRLLRRWWKTRELETSLSSIWWADVLIKPIGREPPAGHPSGKWGNQIRKISSRKDRERELQRPMGARWGERKCERLIGWRSMHSGWLHFNENLDRNRGGRKGQTLKLGKRTVCRCREMAF
jgi:hypothetical protein